MVLMLSMLMISLYEPIQVKSGPELPIRQDELLDAATVNPVSAIINGILKRGERKYEGFSTSTWVPPSDADRTKIKELGRAAIQPLDKELDSPIPFRQLLAVQLLEQVGGVEIVPSVRRGLSDKRWVVVRMQSLSALVSVPDKLAVPLIRQYVADADVRVAQRAKDLLTQHYGVH